jgi:hypothetical protein
MHEGNNKTYILVGKLSETDHLSRVGEPSGRSNCHDFRGGMFYNPFREISAAFSFHVVTIN